ncbi:uncharacterized protein L969DRAFT_94091 [Mixia osmundae IAM 14324]|uniref:DUF6593 domain-containing protein n=1 Tax=Mixia osmundae (strain CBS 9802 / IAM 14324 / JCM 22182 / KY 12970) TaxID=764103 RepID=G7E924_MIXOS|nr:uncharacterized protein L969DRAFT_94091 [Mixia osmundae IAM 14324]KEI40277.1 hypothetical protein L969DRAFT_94091 [Mixia osmundae IAM 14324]GAA99642.1 hypothetical protein E5Q_06343 [Mixia osmundae IAM 14324]
MGLRGTLDLSSKKEGTADDGASTVSAAPAYEPSASTSTPRASISAPVSSSTRHAEDVGEYESFHVYRGRGALSWSKDDVVTFADKKTILFWIYFPRTFWGDWQISVHAHNKQGPLVGTITRPLKFFKLASFTIDIQGYRTVLTEIWSFRGLKLEFAGPDGKLYVWQSVGVFSCDLECIAKASKDLVATFRQSVLALTKDGELRIGRAAMHHRDLLLFTGIAAEEWAAQKRQRRNA